MQSLLVYPTHANLQEELERYQSAGIHAEIYPPRKTEESEQFSQNCWNDEADRAEAVGFPVATTVCFGCPARQQCLEQGYLG
ncbi:hypothetical protein, partial [Thalassoglobus neptunius]|uniref:hypothetical protein n=1 Tax=Thalassoglobus neptunius TaxID=1938619 RepID=UPI0011B5B09B